MKIYPTHNPLYLRLFFLILVLLQVKSQEKHQQAFDEIKLFFDKQIENDPETRLFFMDETKQIPPPLWHDIDAAYLQTRISKKISINTQLVNSILQIRSKSETNKELLDLTLNYNPDLSFALLNPQDFVPDMTNNDPASYCRRTKKIHIKIEKLDSIYFERIFIHELLHAFNDGMQRTFHGYAYRYPSPYYPDEKKDHYNDILNKGDQRLKDFIDQAKLLLLKDNSNTLSSSEKQKFRKIKTVLNAVNTSTFNVNFLEPIQLLLPDDKSLKTLLKKSVGQIVNIDQYAKKSLGNFLLYEIQSIRPDFVLKVFPIVDPLKILTDISTNLNEHIKNQILEYNEHERQIYFTAEKQAYLYQLLPRFCLEQFYPEMLDYDKTLKDQLNKKSLPNSIIDNPFLKKLGEQGIEFGYAMDRRISELDQISSKSAIGYFISAVSYYHIRKDAEKAETLCNALSNNGFFKTTCYEQLANTAMQRLNYNRAYTYYHRASQQGKLTTTKALYHYALSAFESGHILEAKKLLTQYHNSKISTFKQEMQQLSKKIKEYEAQNNKLEL